MFIEVVKSKIHRVTVTEANLNYIGSITIDQDLLDAANLIPNEKVSIVNNNNGNITTEIPVWETGISRTRECNMKRVLSSNAIGYTTEEKEYEVSGGFLTIELSPLEALVLYSRDE